MRTTVALLTLVLGGCVVTSVTPLSNKQYDPVSPDQVVIYLDETDIPGEFEKLAIINAKGESSWTDEKQMYERARKDAAKIGANGILVEQVKEPSAGAKIAGAFLGTGSQRTGTMIAIRVLSQ